jgi:hypothetical protein
MKTPTAVYEALTPIQRVRAAFAAMARDDQAEIDRLRRTCPKKTYTQTDAAYADTMEHLISLSLAMSHDMLTAALNAYLSATLTPGHCEEDLQVLANVNAAGRLIFERFGIDHDLLQKTSLPPHRAVRVMLDAAPPPDMKAAQALADDVTDAWSHAIRVPLEPRRVDWRAPDSTTQRDK